MLEQFNHFAQNTAQTLTDQFDKIDWLNNFVSASMSGIPLTIIAIWGYLNLRSHQKKSIKSRNLQDDFCPALRTKFKKAHGEAYDPENPTYEMKERAIAKVNLRDVYQTNTDLCVSYIQAAAKLAMKSDDPIIFNHLHKVIPEKDRESILEDIIIEFKEHMSAILHAGTGLGSDDTEMATCYPVLVAERDHPRQQIRILVTTEEQANPKNLHTADEVLVEKGLKRFERGNAMHKGYVHLKTMHQIAEQLQSSTQFQDNTYVEYPKRTHAMQIAA